MNIRLLAATTFLALPALAMAQEARPAPSPMPGMQPMPGMSTPVPQAAPQQGGMCGMGGGAQGASGGCSCCRNMAAAPTSSGAMPMMPGMQMAQNPHAGHSMGAAAATSPSNKAYMDAHEAMMKNMAMQPTGDADRDFVAMMTPHHQGAIDMAKVQLQYGKNPELRALAQKIVEDQEREIAQMKAWAEKNR